MLRILTQMLLFVAVLVAPLGMTAAPAAAAHHDMGAGMAMSHCPDEGDGQKQSGGIVDCTMACAAALPVFDGDRGPQLRTAHGPDGVIVVRRLAGILHEIATPPPKAA
jgi:hypothetical protein